MKLKLETREQPDRTVVLKSEANALLMSPPIDESYWAFRVLLGTKGQAIVVFPKYGGWGCGFALEKDYNTNLPVPYTSPEEVFEHIKHNKGDDSIKDDDVLQAIRMVHDAASKASESTRRSITDDNPPAQEAP